MNQLVTVVLLVGSVVVIWEGLCAVCRVLFGSTPSAALPKPVALETATVGDGAKIEKRTQYDPDGKPVERWVTAKEGGEA